MTLVLEIEHLLGVSFAARNPASGVPEWPPQPDRVFSALVAAWAARGERAEERQALEWLERQPAPEIAASSGFPRAAPAVFVPPNDFELSEGVLNSAWFGYLRRGERPPEKGGHATIWKRALGIEPSRRTRTARQFPAFRPEGSLVSLIWRSVTPDAGILAALNALAADTAYIGHSASLTRCRFHDGAAPAASGKPRRRVYPGRLAELEQIYHSGRRPSPGDSGPGDSVAAPGTSRIPMAESFFADGWLTFEHVGGKMPDLRAAALVARALHRAVLAGYERAGLGDAIPAVVSGHAPDGAPLGEPHLAFAPMAFLGLPFADGAVFGFAMIPPRRGNFFGETSFRQALRAIMPWNNETSRRELMLKSDGLNLVFTVAGETSRRSLDPAPYVGTATVWATATPIVLDRHLKEAGGEARQTEIENLLRRACVNIGLPEPEWVVTGKHAAVEGAPSAYPSRHAPSWTGWRLPPSLASRQLTHAVLQFRDPVRGPVMLGAGRFVGLGLCCAFDRAEGRP